MTKSLGVYTCNSLELALRYLQACWLFSWYRRTLKTTETTHKYWPISEQRCDSKYEHVMTCGSLSSRGRSLCFGSKGHSLTIGVYCWSDALAERCCNSSRIRCPLLRHTTVEFIAAYLVATLNVAIEFTAPLAEERTDRSKTSRGRRSVLPEMPQQYQFPCQRKSPAERLLWRLRSRTVSSSRLYECSCWVQSSSVLGL